MLLSWWKKVRTPPVLIGFITALVVAIALIFIEVKLYGTGFAGKTLWDWLQLAIIPAMLAIGVPWFTHLQQQRDQQLADRRAKNASEISLDNPREAALQA